MRITTLNNLNTHDIVRYQNFIARSGGSFLQSWDWGNWQAQNGRKAERYLVADDADNPILAAQLIRYPVGFNSYYLYCPYGPVLAGTNEQQAAAVNTLLAHLKTKYPQCLFVRLEPQQPLPPIKYKLKKTLNILPGSTVTQDITDSPKNLLAQMHPKTRYNIRLAERRGVTVKVIVNPHEWPQVATMLQQTLRRRHLASPPPAYYLSLLQYFAGMPHDSKLEVTTYGAFAKHEMIATTIMLDWQTTRTYLFGGSATTRKDLMAPYLLHWTIIQDGKNKNIRTYDWFGAEGAVSNDSGFARFKLGFGGTVKEYAGAYDIIFQPLKYKLYQLTRLLNRWFKHL